MMSCGRSKEVRTPELIGQIKNFMDRDRCMSIETISTQFDVSVGTVHTIIREELKMRKNCAKFVPGVLREDQKERRCYDSRDMVELISSDPAVLDALVTCDESWIYCYDTDQETLPKGSVLALPDTQVQTVQIHPQTFDDPPLFFFFFFFLQHCHDLHALGPNGLTVNKEYYVEVLREFRKRFRWKRPALFKSGQWHFQQDNAPVHNSTFVIDYLTKMGIKTVPQPSCSRDLAPYNFCLFPKLKKILRLSS